MASIAEISISIQATRYTSNKIHKIKYHHNLHFNACVPSYGTLSVCIHTYKNIIAILSDII